MDWKWSCKICNALLDDANALIRHYLKVHPAAINYGVPVPIDVVPGLKEKTKPKARQYEPVETEDELPDEEEPETKKKEEEDLGFEDLKLE